MSSLPSFDLMPLVLLLFFPQSCLVSWYTPLKWFDLAAFSALKATPSTFFLLSALVFLLTSLSLALYSSFLISIFLLLCRQVQFFFCCFVIYLCHLCSVFAHYHNDIRRKLVDYIKCIIKNDPFVFYNSFYNLLSRYLKCKFMISK